MDITVFKDLELVVCCEVKERASQLEPMIASVKSHGKGVDLAAPDRGNDPLRKAKYLVRRKPRFFSLVAIGRRLEFSVSYGDQNAFRLQEDLIWLP